MAGDPLAVRLVGDGVDRHVEHELTDDLTFSSTMPGGYKSASFGLARPLADYPPELYPYTTCIVYDQRDGAVRWAGRLEVPGRGAPSWAVQASGGAAHASDRQQPLIYVDGRFSEWERVDDFSTGAGVPNATVETTGGAGEVPGLRLAFPRGIVAAPLALVTVRYPHLIASGQDVGRVSVTHFEGLTTGNAVQEIVVRNAALAGLFEDQDTWSTTPHTLVTSRPAIALPNYKYIDYRTNLVVGGTVSTDVTYSQATWVRVRGTLLTAAGVEMVGSGQYNNDYVHADEVVNDLLGRLLPQFAPAVVSTASTLGIQQLAYADGTDAAGVLDDLMVLDPAMRWAAWEPDDSGRWRFEWDTWPNTVELETDASDGEFTSPGAAADLYNRVRVRWMVSVGKSTRAVFSEYSQAVPILDQRGLIRSTTLDLGSEIGSQAAADAAGPAFLAAHAAPTNNGTLTVSRPVMDVTLGRLLQPWEIVAGPLIRIRNLRPSVDALNVTDRDGTSVFRVTEVAYSRRTGKATLTLDSYSDDLVKALARIGRKLDRVRRI